ncbi:hypothetical protein ABIC63_005770 [Pseudacidovorax sp. 1753]|uniref:hypothetical protein n=1 Tax=Pseudacidovorax sp. 1753 TaxID=3156419 RepID=UPI003392BA01
MTTKLHLFALCTFAFATQAQTNPPSPDCRVQQVEGARVEMCLFRGASFQHDRYMLRFDGDVIFVLTDDFAERVELEHTLLDGPAIEYRLSGQDAKTVKLVGGCIPEIKDKTEVARVCNFRLGKHEIVKNQRFEFN